MTYNLITQVIRRGESEPQNASRLVWWIAGLAEWAKPFKVGDIVIEVTHRMGTARSRLGLHSAIGELLKIEETANGKTYLIRDIEGHERLWENCKFCLVEEGAALDRSSSPPNPLTP